jgi:hypothetical protein
VSSFLWIIAAIFALALLGKVLRQLRKDSCLRFFHSFHVSFTDSKGRVMWGAMHLTGQGLELCFDAVHVDARDLAKSGAIVFPPEISEMTAVCRCVHGMTSEEQRLRDQQVHGVLHPSRRLLVRRRLANLGGMVRDAVVDTIGLVLGQIGASPRKSVAALAGSQKQVTEVGGAILDLGARAYEPLLEGLVGKPVIARIDVSANKRVHFPGYLAEYNEKFLVVVNDTQAPEESFELAANGDGHGIARVSMSGTALEIACEGDDALVVKRIVGRTGDRQAVLDIGAALLPGSRISMHLPAQFEVDHVEIDRTRRLDFVCPRARSQVRYSSARPPVMRDDWHGVSPQTG